MGRILAIVVVVGLMLFGGYKIFAGRVDSTDPKSVAAEFLKSLKSENISRAKKYYLPDKADAWQTATEKTLYQMKSNESQRFKDSIPDQPEFTPGTPVKGSNDTILKTGEVEVGLREMDGKWYVSRSPY